MPELKLIDGVDGSASYNPEQVQMMQEAFDGAWAYIESGVSGRQTEIEATRSKLAHIILRISGDGAGTAKDMQDEAIKKMFAQPVEL